MGAATVGGLQLFLLCGGVRRPERARDMAAAKGYTWFIRVSSFVWRIETFVF